MSLFKKITSLFAKKKSEAVVEKSDTLNSSEENDAEHLNIKSKRSELFMFDNQRRIFVMKKRISEPALYFPDTKQVLIKHADSTETEVTFQSDISDKAFPISCRWNNEEVGSIALFDPESSQFIIKKSNDAEEVINFNLDKDDKLTPLIGHWGDSQKAAVGIYNADKGFFYLKKNTTNKDESGISTIKYESTHPNIIPLLGDWNGKASDDIGFYDQESAVFYLHDTEHTDFVFGEVDKQIIPLVGNWNGSGIDSIGTYHPKQGLFILRYERDTKMIVNHFLFGSANRNAIPLVGDWDGSGKDNIGIYDNEISTVYLNLEFESTENFSSFIFSRTEKNAMPFVHSSVQ